MRLGTRRRHIGTALAAVALAGAMVTVATADDISNNLDGSIDAIAEIMPLEVGGSNGTTTLYINPQNAATDGDNGCNFDGATEKLVLDLASSNSSVARVNSQVT